MPGEAAPAPLSHRPGLQGLLPKGSGKGASSVIGPHRGGRCCGSQTRNDGKHPANNGRTGLGGCLSLLGTDQNSSSQERQEPWGGEGRWGRRGGLTQTSRAVPPGGWPPAPASRASNPSSAALLLCGIGEIHAFTVLHWSGAVEGSVHCSEPRVST